MSLCMIQHTVMQQVIFIYFKTKHSDSDVVNPTFEKFTFFCFIFLFVFVSGFLGGYLLSKPFEDKV